MKADAQEIARRALAKCQCGHPRIDHRHGGTTADHCLHRSGCWGHVDCFPCRCDSFEPRGGWRGMSWYRVRITLSAPVAATSENEAVRKVMALTRDPSRLAACDIAGTILRVVESVQYEPSGSRFDGWALPGDFGPPLDAFPLWSDEGAALPLPNPGMPHPALVAMLTDIAEPIPCEHPDTEPVLEGDRVVDMECLLCGTTASEGFEA